MSRAVPGSEHAQWVGRHPQNIAPPPSITQPGLPAPGIAPSRSDTSAREEGAKNVRVVLHTGASPLLEPMACVTHTPPLHPPPTSVDENRFQKHRWSVRWQWGSHSWVNAKSKSMNYRNGTGASRDESCHIRLYFLLFSFACHYMMALYDERGWNGRAAEKKTKAEGPGISRDRKKLL